MNPISPMPPARTMFRSGWLSRGAPSADRGDGEKDRLEKTTLEGAGAAFTGSALSDRLLAGAPVVLGWPRIGARCQMTAADPNRVIVTGENPFIRLSAKQGDSLTTSASFWRIIFCPAGPGNVLYLNSELTDNRWRIYADNIAM